MRILKAALISSTLFLFKSTLWALVILTLTAKDHFVPNPFFYLWIGTWVNLMGDLVDMVYKVAHNNIVRRFS